jgi:hypothetical protein
MHLNEIFNYKQTMKNKIFTAKFYLEIKKEFSFLKDLRNEL